MSIVADTDALGPRSIWAWILVGVFLYYSGVAIYRLHFSPIAKFPGPRLAGLTFWFQFYHDVLRQGQYGFEIRKMHRQYGERFLVAESRS